MPRAFPSTVATSRSPAKKSFHPYCGCFMVWVRLTSCGVWASWGMFVPYWYEMSGCWPPCSATVAFCSAKSLLTYCIRMWILGCCLVNSATCFFSVLYSAAGSGGGGVKPIHITRLTVPPDPVDPVPLLPEQAAASTVRATAADAPTRHTMRCWVLMLPISPPLYDAAEAYELGRAALGLRPFHDTDYRSNLTRH